MAVSTDVTWSTDRSSAKSTRGRALDRAVVFIVCVVCPVALFVGAWALSGFGGNGGAKVLALIGAVIGIAVALIVGYVANRCSPTVRLVSALLSAATMVGLATATFTGLMQTAKLRLDQSSWQASLASIHPSEVGCRPYRPGELTLKDLGEVTQVCSTEAGYSGQSIVIFFGPHLGTNLIYTHSGAAPGADNCVKQIAGPWWQSTTLSPNLDCPWGWTFVPGP